MMRYATDTTDEGEEDASWWVTSLLMADIPGSNLPLSHFTPDPNVAAISKWDEHSILQNVQRFLRAIEAGDNTGAYEALSAEFRTALIESDVENFTGTLAQVDARYACVYNSLFVFSYDILSSGIALTVQAKDSQDNWEKLVFTVLQECDGSWKISWLPDVNLDEDFDDASAIEADADEDGSNQG